VTGRGPGFVTWATGGTDVRTCTEARKIVRVQDNLNTHGPASLYAALPTTADAPVKLKRLYPPL